MKVRHDHRNQTLCSFTASSLRRSRTRPPLLLLHGTGGDENDLINLRTPRCAWTPRCCRRAARCWKAACHASSGGLPEGVFDEADVKRRANELADFVSEAREEYGLPGTDRTRLLQRCQYRRRDVAAAAGGARGRCSASRQWCRCRNRPRRIWVESRVLILSGAMDPIVPAANARIWRGSCSTPAPMSNTGRCRPATACHKPTRH